MTTINVKENIRNGVNVDQLVETINHIKEQPELARFQFRATTEWEEGARARTRVKEFYGAGKEDDSRRHAFVLEGDEPPVLLGDNTAANAVESVLHALGSCLAVGYAYNAAAQGIEIEELEFDIKGDLDLRGFLGLSDDTRAGFDKIDVTWRVKSDAPRAKLEELCRYVQKTSPVVDIIRNPVPLSITMEAP